MIDNKNKIILSFFGTLKLSQKSRKHRSIILSFPKLRMKIKMYDETMSKEYNKRRKFSNFLQNSR
jgi:hypothetical protein